jgi:hypothetical protein
MCKLGKKGNKNMKKKSLINSPFVKPANHPVAPSSQLENGHQDVEHVEHVQQSRPNQNGNEANTAAAVSHFSIPGIVKAGLAVVGGLVSLVAIPAVFFGRPASVDSAALQAEVPKQAGSVEKGSDIPDIAQTLTL